MKYTAAFLLILATIFICSCTSAREQQSKIRTASLAIGECKIHHCPLRKCVAYKMDRKAFIDYYEYVYTAHYKYPNAIPLEYLEKPDAAFHFVVPETISYCPICEEKLSIYTKKISSRPQ